MQSKEKTEQKKVYFISLQLALTKNEQQMDFMLLFKCLFPSLTFFLLVFAPLRRLLLILWRKIYL